MSLKVTPIELLLKKYNGEEYTVYRPAFKNDRKSCMLLKVVNKSKLHVSATLDTESKDYPPYVYAKKNLTRIHLKLEWLGYTVDITEDPRLDKILSSTHLIVNSNGKIKKIITRC